MQYKLVDVNSAQYQQDMQRLQSLRTQVVLWLIVLALGVLLIPLTLITGWVRNDVARLENELLTVQNALNSATTPSEEVIKLTSDIANIDQLISTMQTVTIPSGVKWPQVVEATARYDATAIEITSLTQTSNNLQIAGRATSSDAVVRYQQILLDTGTFNDVVVVSMSTAPAPVVVEAALSTDTNSAGGTGANSGVDPGQELAARPFGNVEFIIDLVIESSAP